MLFSHRRDEPRIIVHADDFGMSPDQSRRILARSSACGGRGALNSVSVLVTSPRLAECVDILRPFEDKMLIGLHVNLVEGPCAANWEDVPLLAGSDGMFKRGFGGVLLGSLLHPRAMRDQVACEVAAQIELFCAAFPAQRDHLRVDSHQHFHMIPAVFDGVVAALDRTGCALEYLRIPAEPTRPFSKSHKLGAVKPINWVKHIVLNTLWKANRRKVPGLEERTGVFCGINFSGTMNADNVRGVLDEFKRLALEQVRPLELLFHPGGIDDPAECLNPSLPGFVAFYQSTGRSDEAEALTALEAELVS